MAEKLVLVSAIDELNKGDTFEDQDWPLHVTVMPWFRLPSQYKQGFIGDVANHTHTVDPISLIGDTNEVFGINEHTPRDVRTLRNIARVTRLHEEMLGIVNEYAGEIDSLYIRNLYRPHVTYQRGRGIDENEEITLSQMQLIKGDKQGTRRVEHVFNFAENETS